MNKIAEIKDLSVGYDSKIVLKDVKLNIYEQDFLGIIGPNGGGKTTLLKVLLGLLKPLKGSITFYDKGKKASSIRMGYLPQLNNIDRKFPISVADVVASGLMRKKRLFKGYTAEQKEKIFQTIHEMGLDELENRPIGELSGGQVQRVLLGRALVSEPQLLILDEPNSYVDKRFESHLYEHLERINKDTAIIFVSHDIGTVLRMTKNVACINETLHYHAGSDAAEEWIDTVFDCPIELVGHGDFPHRILKTHTHE